ncbi:hypothetical protein KQI61_05735 [Anaerocolumna aminovalerica]|uniref:hypothetical protein n=1 Tax=Anaerocolumna aminovalerica TaxID=1527 RepID=UPI001C0EE6D0|nr:hypothetical protein [Anaerocolumna aminovalerica]MBU5331691.1 hypothetical protein [Anaerocolumna aminovalerica]
MIKERTDVIIITIIVIGLLLYCAYEKYCETKQVESISKMDWLSYKEVNELISKVKN